MWMQKRRTAVLFSFTSTPPPLEVNEKKCYLSGKLIMDGGMKTSGQGRKIFVYVENKGLY